MPQPLTPVRDLPNGSTRMLGIFGWPLSYSLSPRFQNAALRAARLPAVYLALPSPNEKAFLALLAGLQQSPQFLGGNVTNPFKIAALKRVDRLSPAAKAIGAVNTLVRGKRGWEGHNTDAGGFLAALRSARISLAGRRVLLLGAGGAARALAWACGQGKAARLMVLARRRGPAQDCARLAGRIGASGVLDLKRVTELSREADVVLNALPGEDLGKRFGSRLFPKSGTVVDIGYVPAETAFCRYAKARGWRTLNGQSMLLEQGALAFELWFKKTAPRSQMRAALRKI
jgi:shikimate dehydrogenase